MKYSFIMPYYKREKQFKSTLESFKFHYSDRDDFEIIVLEDVKNKNVSLEHNSLVNLINIYSQCFPIRLYSHGANDCWNPSIAFNTGVSIATGDFIILTNPECLHETNILNGLDEEFKLNINNYIVCACKSVKVSEISVVQARKTEFTWYQHSEIRNTRAHFCSAMSKLKFNEIGGFDVEYAKGICYEDDDFRNTIEKAGITIITRDDLIVVHLNHIKPKPTNYTAKYALNKLRYDGKWGKKSFRCEDLTISASNVVEVWEDDK